MVRKTLAQCVHIGRRQLSERDPYNDECEDGLCYYAYVNSSGRVVDTKNTACHAGIAQFRNNPKVIINWTMPYHEEWVSEAWFRYMVHPISPWYGCVSPDLNTDPKFMSQHGMLFTQLDQPANYIANALIATRVPGEHNERASVWYTLTKGGVDPTLAWVLASMYDGSSTLYNQVYGGHYPLGEYGGVIDTTTVNRLVTGKPDPLILKRTAAFNRNPDYMPCNAIWKGDESQPFRDGVVIPLLTGPGSGVRRTPRFKVGCFHHGLEREDGTALSLDNLTEVGLKLTKEYGLEGRYE